MNPRKNVLIISYSLLHRDPRILRQIQALKDDYDIQTIGLTAPGIDGVSFYETAFTYSKNIFEKATRFFHLLLHRYEEDIGDRLSVRRLSEYDYKVPDAIFANDWNGLFAAASLKAYKGWSCGIYFDSHEYFPRYRESLSWKTFELPSIRYALGRTRSSFTVMSTVCPTLACMYEDYFGFERGAVQVITNAPAYEPELAPQPVGERIRLIHHGGAMRERQLEKMIDMMAYLPADRYELTFMLVKNDGLYYHMLQKRAARYPNIRFMEPVPVAEIPSITNKFDIGLFILNNGIVNYRYALPNKFFEFVQARLAIAVGDSPEMRSYIERYQLGVSAGRNTSKAMAEEILKLSKDDIMRFKGNADSHARELSAEPNIDALRRIAAEVIHSQDTP